MDYAMYDQYETSESLEIPKKARHYFSVDEADDIGNHHYHVTFGENKSCDFMLSPDTVEVLRRYLSNLINRKPLPKLNVEALDILKNLQLLMLT